MATRTRNRTSRLAVLDSSVRRPASTSSTGRSRSPLLRRAVVIGLVVAVAGADHDLLPGVFGRPAPRRAEHRGRGDEAVRGRCEPRRAPVPRRLQLVRRPRHRQEREQAAQGRGRAAAPAVRDGADGAERERDAQAAAPLRARPELPEGLPSGERERGRPRRRRRAGARHRVRGHEPGRARQRSRRDDRRARRQGDARRERPRAASRS